MGIAYTEFDTTPATIVADIKAKILLSSDWANPTGQVVKCVAGNTAHLAVDLADAAATNLVMTLGVYRSHNGTTGTDKLNRYLHWHRAAATSAATDIVHCVVSAGPDHLFISVEGPRGGEANPDTATTGSQKTTFALAAIVPYYGSDTIPTVCAVGAAAATSTTEQQCYVARNKADTLSWVPAILETVSQWNNAVAQQFRQGARIDMDANFVLRPWLVNEITGGDRGRLSDIFYAGFQYLTRSVTSDPIAAIGQKVTYGGDTFTLLEAGRATVTAHAPCGGWGNFATTIVFNNTPLIAVPSA